MKDFTSRRAFMRKSVIATTGIALLSTNIISAVTNENPYEGYNEFAEEKTDLRNSLFGEHVRINGVVYNSEGTLPIKNALVEVWHLSPNSTKYRHRTKLRTNEAGEYNFISDYPNNEESKVPRVYFKISHDNRTKYTDLVLNKTGGHISDKHWENNRHLGDRLFPISNKSLNSTDIKFNLSI